MASLEEIYDEYLQVLSRDLNCLQDENRNSRKRALENIRNCTVLKKPPLDNEILHMLLMHIYKSILRCFSDSVEKCREIAVDTIIQFWRYDPECKEILCYLVTVLTQNLGQHDIMEPSEEIRLLEVELIYKIIQDCQESLHPYLNDFVNILRKTIVDPYPEVKKVSCSCAAELAKALPSRFHMQSESLINPLLQAATHQHAKVRVASIMALGTVIQYGNNKSVDDCVSHLAQRLFDYTAQVRLAVAKVVGTWLCELPDRYSYFYRLIPLILTCMMDDLQEIRQTAEDLWLKAGKIYEQENENDLKDSLDFPKEQPEHYPPNVVRSNLGCRTLVQQNFSKILPALLNDLDDWVAATRLKAAQLLYNLLLAGENTITQHLSRVLTGLYRACGDNEQAVVDEVQKAAEIIGYFIKPEIYCELILENIKMSPSPGNLMVLAAVIRGTESIKLAFYLEDICNLLSNPEICQDFRVNYQAQIISCVEAIIKVGKQYCKKVSNQIFIVLLTEYSLGMDEDIRCRAKTLMHELCNVMEFNHLHELFSLHLRGLLETLKKSQNSWTVQSPETFILDAILLTADLALEENLDLLIPMLIENLKPEKESKLRLKLFTTLSNLMLNLGEKVDFIKTFATFISIIIQDIIIPNLVWQAGKTARALRAAAISYFWALLKSGRVTAEQIKPASESLLRTLISVLDDSYETTRLMTCRVLKRILNIYQDEFETLQLQNLYPEFLKRLDDSSNDVRFAAVELFESYLDVGKVLFDPICHRGHVEEIYIGLLVHMDDPDEQLQEAIFNLLMKNTSLQPEMLQEKIKEVRHKHRTAHFCDKLLEHIDALHIST